jgi:Phage envelope protein
MEFRVMLKSYFEQVRCKSDFLTFLTELQRNNVSYYIYFVATGNVKVITTSDNYVSVEGSRGIIKISANASKFLTRVAAKRHFAGRTSYEQYCLELANAGVFKWIVDLNENMRFYWSKDNQLLYCENVLPVPKATLQTELEK